MKSILQGRDDDDDDDDGGGLFEMSTEGAPDPDDSTSEEQFWGGLSRSIVININTVADLKLSKVFSASLCSNDVQ